MITTKHKRVFMGLMATAAIAVAMPGHAAAQDAPKFNYNVGAEDLGKALTSLARQSNKEIYFSSDLTRGRRAPAVKGELTTEQALQQLLAGSGLAYKFNDSGAIVIERELGNASAAASDDAAASEEQKIAEILVVGKRNSTLNADIKRTEDDPQPYVVFDSESIERSGATNLQDFFRRRLPMEANFVPTSQQNNAPGANTSSINLRGLGAAQTLILINGRRAPNVSFAGIEGQPDINGVPLGAIERIEVLPATASGIYGGGATAGAINIILKRDYQGIDLTLRHSNAFAGGSARTGIDLSGGFSLEDGKTTVFFAGSYESANPLLRGERDFIDRYRAEYYANTSGHLPPNAPPIGALTNIRSTSGNLVLDNGTALNSPMTSVPAGYAGPGIDGGTGLALNAGQYNLLAPPSAQSNGERQLLLLGTDVFSVMGNVQRSFGSNIRVFLDGSYSSNRSSTPVSTLNSTFTIAGSAAGNPFQQAVQVAIPGPSADSNAKSKYTNLRFTGGVIAKLPHDWSGEFDYTWGRQSAEYKNAGTINTAGILAAISSGSLNVFRDLDQFPLDLTPYLTPDNIDFPQDSTLNDASLRLGGPIVHLPGGDMTATILLESRKADRETARSYNPTSSRGAYYPARSQTVRSAYAELYVPLVSAENRRPFVEELQLQLSARHDRYVSHGVTSSISYSGSLDDFFDFSPNFVEATNKVQSTDFTVAVKWSPIPDLAFRASYGTGFVPPSVDQLASRTSQSSGGSLVDPLRGNTLVTGTINFVEGGSADLQPEESRSFSAGLILTPKAVPGLRVSIDYVNVKKTDNIALYPGGSQGVVIGDAEGVISGKVLRDAPSAADIAQGYAGPINTIDITFMNLARASMEAFDAQLDYNLPTDIGNFDFFAIGSYQPHHKTQVTETQPTIENVGFFTGALKWKGNFGVNWSHGPWSAGWTATYYNSYLAYIAGSAPSTIAIYKSRVHGSDLTISSQMYHDLEAAYKFGGNLGLLSGSELRLGVQNIFNAKPPRYGQGISLFGDPRLARFTVALKKHF